MTTKPCCLFAIDIFPIIYYYYYDLQLRQFSRKDYCQLKVLTVFFTTSINENTTTKNINQQIFLGKITVKSRKHIKKASPKYMRHKN